MNTENKKTHSKEQTDIFAWFSLTLINTFACLVVIARAGVGKTYTAFIALFFHAPEVKQGLPVLYAVFNKRNQTEAKEKQKEWESEYHVKYPNLDVRTWHSVGFSILQKHYRFIKGNDSVEWTRVESVTTTGPDGKELHKGIKFLACQLISVLKNYRGIPSMDFALKTANLKGIDVTKSQTDAGYDVSYVCNLAIEGMKKALILDKGKRISYGDMGGWLPDVLGIIKPTYALILADEGQDLNEVQFSMLEQLRLSASRVCIIGDDRQAIYGWRGAMQSGLATMRDKLGAATLKLTATFRCGKKIVELAKTIVPDYVAHDSNAEGSVESCNEAKMITDAKIGDAILSRTNAPLMRHCLGFIRQGKTARIEGKDVARMLIATIEQVEGNDSNFGERLSIWEQVRIAKQNPDHWDATKKIELIQDTAETLRVVWESCDTITAMATKINGLFQDSGSEYAKPCILLSTVHKAKGLEWERVYVLRSTFGNRAPANDEERDAEENVKYVAITRAKCALVNVS